MRAIRIVGSPLDGARERRDVAGRCQAPCVAVPDQLANTGNVASDHRHARGAAFHQDSRQAFRVRRQDDDVALLEQRPDILNGSGERDARADAERFGELLGFTAGRAIAGESQERAGLDPDAGERMDEHPECLWACTTARRTAPEAVLEGREGGATRNIRRTWTYRPHCEAAAPGWRRTPSALPVRVPAHCSPDTHDRTVSGPACQSLHRGVSAGSRRRTSHA